MLSVIPNDSSTQPASNKLTNNLSDQLTHRLQLIQQIKAVLKSKFTCLKNKIESNSTWERTFYQTEWVKINSSCVIFIFFSFKSVVGNVSEMFCDWKLLMPFLLSF